MRRLFVTLTAVIAICLQGQAQSVLANDFSTVAQFESYTVIDQNQDGQTWHYDDLMQAARCTRDYDADDWLIAPMVRLSAEKTYKLTINANIEQESGEKLGVFLGSSATVGGMTRQLLACTVDRMSPTDYEVIFTVASLGNYWLGIHFMTQDDPFYNALCLNSIVLEETINQNVPAAVADLRAVADANGARQVVVSFTTPTLAVSGQPLEELTSVDVYRDKDVVTTIDAPAKGTALTFTDEGMSEGSHTYKVVPVNRYGEGLSSQTTVYVGQDAPGPVENLRFVYDHATGQATLTWDAPTKGANGGFFNPEGITYEVRRFHANDPLAKDLTDPTSSARLSATGSSTTATSR